jgi:hypothetical protein
MTDSFAHYLQPGSICVSDGAVWLSDITLPVVIEVDSRTGTVVRRFSWDPGAAHDRALPAATAMVASADAVWVCSPRAGGVVVLDRRDGSAVVVTLPRPADGLWLDGSTCLAREEAVDARFDEPPAPQRLWRVGADLIGTIDLASAVADVAASENGVFVLVHRSSDRPGGPDVRPGYTVDFRPGALVKVDPEGTTHVITERDDIHGRLFYDAGQLWTTGFGRIVDGIRAVDSNSGATGTCLSIGDAALGLEVAGGHVWWISHPSLRATNEWDFAMTVNRRSLHGGPITTSTLVGSLRDMVAFGRCSWCIRWRRRGEGWDLVRIDIDDPEPSIFSVSVDLTDLLPVPVPPAGVDPAVYSKQEWHRLHDSLMGGRTDQTGRRTPFITGVTFASVEVQGEFPQTKIVALFRHQDRPGILFGRSWRIYDDLGQLAWLEYVDINLMESIQARGHGLPPVNRCKPDQNGVVWF